MIFFAKIFFLNPDSFLLSLFCFHTRLGRIDGDVEDTGDEFAVLGVDSFRISPFVEQVI